LDIILVFLIMKKKFYYFIVFLIGLLLVAYFWVHNANNYKRDGAFDISVNDEPIKIIRDEHGIAYVIAQNKADVYRGQGFVLAQDRLFQIEFYRALIKGEAAALVGQSMVASDIKMHVLDVYGNAERSFQYLDSETKQTLEWYCEGFNTYLEVGQDEFPLELSLLGISPKPIKPVDIVSVIHFIGLFHSQNMDDEILSLNLAASTDIAEVLRPLSVNIDRTKPLHFELDSINFSKGLQSTAAQTISNLDPSPFPKLGSNNLAIAGKKSKNGKPILSNDPHVDSRLLPGMFYPIGLICPDFKAVGIATPGVPGLLSGRNEFVSFGVTNAYGDSQDLYIETLKGDKYLQNDSLKPLTIRTANITVKDSTAFDIEIRATERGPIISDFSLFNIKTDDAVSLRWSLAETKSKSLGIDKLLDTKNVFDFRTALFDMDAMFFNFVFADVEGNIAHQATGLVPVRANKSGEAPIKVDTLDNWLGFIPKDQMPHQINPDRGWLGTANHDTRPDDYPYYYSNHFSPFYRYKRMSELLSDDKLWSPDDLWTMIFDVKNTQAKDFVPLFVAALKDHPDTKDFAEILKNWNQKDHIDEVGATIYTVLYNELLYLVLNDELPDELENQYWENVYYWNQRVDSLMLKNHPFIDNINTSEQETLKDLIVQAGINTKQILTEKFGGDPSQWTWGKLHTVKFVSPLRTKGFGTDLMGGVTYPKNGSNQTLNRGGFVKNSNHEYDTSWFSSYRMVADMSDSTKVMGVISGGSAARVFHPYYKSQLEHWYNEEWLPYWFAEDAIYKHAAYELLLE
jgi:penicillin G amidase